MTDGVTPDTQHTCLQHCWGGGRRPWRHDSLLTLSVYLLKYHLDSWRGIGGMMMMICRIRWTKTDASERVGVGGKVLRRWETKSRKSLGSRHYLRIIILILSRLSRDTPALSAASSGARYFDCCWDLQTTSIKRDGCVIPWVMRENDDT